MAKLFKGTPLSELGDQPLLAAPRAASPLSSAPTALPHPTDLPEAPVEVRAIGVTDGRLATGRRADAAPARPTPTRPTPTKPAPAKPARPTLTSQNEAQKAKGTATAESVPDADTDAALPGTRLLPISRLAQNGRWRVEAMRAYSEPLLLWFTRGQGRITIGGITRGYGAHNAILIPAGMMHGFDLGAQTSGSALFFGRAHGLDLPVDPVHLRLREVGPQAELAGIIEAIQRELESARPGHERAARFHLGLLGVFIERLSASAADEAPMPDAARRLARAYADLLEKNFRTGRGVADFARDLGVTPTHLTRVCNKTCGRSASDLLHDRLLFEARKLLTETRLPVQDVARTLGYTTPAYFTRAFQARTGRTPTDFRKGR